MAWLEQCEVCGGVGGGFFCCHRNPDLNQACPQGGGGPGVLQEFQFFGQQGGGIAWLVNDAARAAGEAVSEDMAPMPPLVAPAAWDSDCRRGSCSPRWPILDGGSAAASLLQGESAPKSPAAPASFGAAMPFCGGADAPNLDAAEAEKTTSSGKDDSSSMDREARVLRYREKKKRRKFGKQIRYASRKAYAEARPRIRGRFAKAPEVAQPPLTSLPLPSHFDAEHIDMGWFRAFRP